MPVVALSYDILLDLIYGSESSRDSSKDVERKQEISDMLPFLGLDIESDDKSDKVRIEYSPNRPDYSIEYGVALGLQGLLGVKTGLVKFDIKRSEKYLISADSAISPIRPFVTGIVATNGTVDDKLIEQLMTMQEDLHLGLGRRRKKASIGIHDLNKVAFPLVYTAVNRDHKFVPLHSQEELAISEILTDTKIGVENAFILGQSSLVPIILDANQHTVSFPPIINGAVTTVTTATKDLLVEITGMNKQDVEHVLSIISIILQTAGFTLESVEVSGAGNSTPKFDQRVMTVDVATINETLGLNLDTAKILSCLQKSRLDASPQGADIVCTVPAYRFDIFGPMDLVEEVALGYGIGNLEPVLHPSQTLGQVNPISFQLRSLDKVMTGLGYLESLNSSLTSKRVLYDMVNRDDTKLVSVLDSKSKEHTILRDSLLPGLIENLSRNIHESYPQNMFETGTVFIANDSIREKTHLSCISAYNDASFTEIKSVLQSALNIGFGIKVETKTALHAIFEKGHCADIIFNGKSVGIIGKIDSKIIENYRIRVPVVGFEISLSDSVLKNI